MKISHFKHIYHSITLTHIKRHHFTIMFPYAPSHVELPSNEWDKLINQRIYDLKREYNIHEKMKRFENKKENGIDKKITSYYEIDKIKRDKGDIENDKKS